MPVTRTCKNCGAPFQCSPGGRQKYCTKECSVVVNRHHGYSGTREHATWLDMRNRCRNPKYYNYAGYGARGIKVCERWDSFENFLADMGPRPGPGYSIERKDNDGDYEPSNCKWGTKLEQSRNRRGVLKPEDVERVQADPVSTVAALAAKFGCSRSAIYRIRKAQAFEHTSPMRQPEV